MQTSQTESELANRIGEFLVHHGCNPRVEHVDNVKWDDSDVRQEAMYRCLRVFDKNGLVITDDNLMTTIYEHKYAAVRNLTNARIDAIRRLRGRGSQRGKDKRTQRTARSGDCKLDGWIWVGDSDLPGIEQGVIDPTSNHAHDRIDADFEGEIRRIYERATLTEQKAIRVLAEWQRRKECGENTYPLRKAIHKLKKKLRDEGSQFDLNPRFL